MKRPLCTTCKQKPGGINYIRNGKTYYRTKCDSCIRKAKKIKAPIPKWSMVGYKKKLVCDKCGFRARWIKQMVIYYVDGNMNNTNLNNLKSVCLNCTVVIEKNDMSWTPDLTIGPDN